MGEPDKVANVKYTDPPKKLLPVIHPSHADPMQPYPGENPAVVSDGCSNIGMLHAGLPDGHVPGISGEAHIRKVLGQPSPEQDSVFGALHDLRKIGQGQVQGNDGKQVVINN